MLDFRKGIMESHLGLCKKCSLNQVHIEVCGADYLNMNTCKFTKILHQLIDKNIHLD